MKLLIWLTLIAIFIELDSILKTLNDILEIIK
jgi:hypothetical protein